MERILGEIESLGHKEVESLLGDNYEMNNSG